MATHRRSADEVEADIRAAVLAELDEGGYAAVTFEGIARRVGTSKPVLYRRYRDRAAMIFDAMRSRGPAAAFPGTTGSLPDDLLTMIGLLHRTTVRFGAESNRALLGEARDETLIKTVEMTMAAASRIDALILQPARERGELGPLPMAPEVVLAPLRLSRDRLLFGPPGDDCAAEIATRWCCRCTGRSRAWTTDCTGVVPSADCVTMFR